MNHEEIPASAARTRAANPALPTAEQLQVARAERWHQAGNPLLSFEDVRSWLQRSGLVLYGPKAQLGAPAPSLVEATLGKASAAPDGAEQEAAKSLMARLIAEGSAVPLNLLGATGGMRTDQPDFVVSAAVFSYIFTLRGNKSWKQMPVTSGAVKVSPLALAVYEVLSAKVTMSAYDLATQLGGGVSEGPVLRALTELWSQLRVLPVPQQDGSATNWELASGRFTKQIKAGANAGQPSALSALASLYLGQAVAAAEDEIESFLSPLAPRSRVRDVVHALVGARQLETLVIEGKTLLHLTGELPAFAAATAPAAAEEAGEGEATGQATERAGADEGGSRIRKFAAKPGSKIGTGLKAKPAFGKTAFGSKSASSGYGGKPALERRPASGEQERRPFKRAERGGYAGGSGAGDKPRFDKPWQEKRPAGDAGAGGDRPARRDFKPRAGDGPKRTFSEPGTFGRKREGASADGGFEGRPPRREFAGRGERPARRERPERAGSESGSQPGRRPGSYSPRPTSGTDGAKPYRPKPKSVGSQGGGETGEAPRKVFRKFDAPRTPRPGGSKPSFGARSGDRPAPRSFGAPKRDERPARSFDGARTERPAAGSNRAARPGSGDRPGFGAKRPAFGEKTAGRGAKKPFARTAGGFKGAGGPFAKFADGKKPFRKPGPPKKAAGGFAPTKRKRDEDSL